MQGERYRVDDAFRGAGAVGDGEGASTGEGGARILQQGVLGCEEQVLRVVGGARVGLRERGEDRGRSRVARVHQVGCGEREDEDGQLGIGEAGVVEQSEGRGAIAEFGEQVETGGGRRVGVLSLGVEGYLVEFVVDGVDNFVELGCVVVVDAVEGVELVEGHGRLAVDVGPAVGAVQREDEVVEIVEGVVAGTLGCGEPLGGGFGFAGVQGDELTQKFPLGGVAVLLAAGQGLAGCGVRVVVRLDEPAGAGGVDGAVYGAVGGHGEGCGGVLGAGVGVEDGEGLFVAADFLEAGAGLVGGVDGCGVDA